MSLQRSEIYVTRTRPRKEVQEGKGSTARRQVNYAGIEVEEEEVVGYA
jgi:hypothetical protein